MKPFLFINPLRMLLAVTIISSALSGCGFHLRGINNSKYKLPFTSLYLQCSNVVICSNLSNAILSQGLTTLVNDPKQAQTILKLNNETTSRDPQAFNSVGRIAAYNLSYQVTVQVWQNSEQVGHDMVIRTQAVMQYNDSMLLASNQNEAEFWNNLHEDATNLLLRKLIYTMHN